jgi:hypothetical protein
MREEREEDKEIRNRVYVRRSDVAIENPVWEKNAYFNSSELNSEKLMTPLIFFIFFYSCIVYFSLYFFLSIFLFIYQINHI